MAGGASAAVVDAVDDPDEGEPATERDPGFLRRAWGWCARHPLLVVAGFASVIAAGHIVWIWSHRTLGAYDPDEAGYIATSFRYHRILASDPLALPRAIGGTGTGPLVPLLSVPLLVLGPFDARSVMMVQPILMVTCAVAAAGIARRLAGPGSAVVAGVAVTLMPTMVLATQSYWLGLGAAAFFSLAVWALLASDRLTNRWTFAYGAAAGLMLLTRTMTLGYLPAIALAGLVVAGRRRESLVGWAKAMAVMVAVALPWWVAAREPVFDYLFSYGYGERAGLFGGGGPLARVDQRVEGLRLNMGLADWRWFTLLVVMVVCAPLRWRGRPATARSAAAVGAAVLLGLAALVSTSNNGVWFDLPLAVVTFPLLVAAASSTFGVIRWVAVANLLVLGAYQLTVSWWLVPFGHDRPPGIPAVVTTSHYEYGFEHYDPRFGPARRDEHDDAARDWFAANDEVEEALRRLTDDGYKVYYLSGNFELLNSNTVQLASELRSWSPWIWIPDTVGDAADRAGYLTPEARTSEGVVVTGGDGKPFERILVFARHDHHLFTPDAQVDDLYAEALDAGWKVVDEVPLPGGGVVEVLRHPQG